MMDEYYRNASRVIEEMRGRGCSESTLGVYARCYAELGDRLEADGSVWDAGVASAWLVARTKGMGEVPAALYSAAVRKVSDLYGTGSIRPYHRTAPTIPSRLCARNREILDGHCAWLAASGKADATVGNHRHAVARMMLDLEAHGCGDVSRAGYDDLWWLCDRHEGDTYYARTGFHTALGSLMAYLHEEGLAPYGFTLVAHAVGMWPSRWWLGAGGEGLERLRDGQDGQPGLCSLEGFIEIRDALLDEHASNGYAKNALAAVGRTANLLYLFMDANGLSFGPGVPELWLPCAERSLSPNEYSGVRRVVLLAARLCRGEGIDLARSFRSVVTLRDRLPGWCAPLVNEFLELKALEGWRGSTLDMYRSGVCRFCLFLHGRGLRGFSELTAGEVKAFNVEDRHRTPAGKNAYNSRVRKFLEWLGERGALDNPLLFLALPNVAAPREELVVTLTADEERMLGDALSGGALRPRERAEILLGLHMGIRGVDVAGLVIDSIDWGLATVRLTQSKTGYEVDLPMPTDVANALFRYIVDERPASDRREVFIRRRAPYTPLDPQACQAALRQALPGRSVPGSGFHVLRKTFATNLLRAGAAARDVAEALGHRDLHTVNKYMSLDEERMRSCALSLAQQGIQPKGGLFDE